MKTIYAKVELDTAGAIKSVEQLDDALVKTTANTEDLTDEVTKNGGAMAILNQLTGGLAQQFKDSYEAVALSTKGLSGFRKALIATGVGAAVVAIGLLIENWDKLKEMITSTTAAQKAYKESIDKIVGSVGEMQTKLSKATDQIELAKKGIVDKDEALKLYNESLGEAVGFAESLEQAESLLVANANTVITITKLKAQAEVLYAKAAEGRAKVIAGDESLNPSFWQQLGNSILSFGNVAAYTAKNSGSLVKNTNDALKQASELESAAADVQRQIAETEAQLQKGGLSPEEVAKKNTKIAELRKQQVKDVKESADKEVDIEAEKAAALERIRQGLIDTDAERRAEQLRQIQTDYDEQIALAQQFYGLASLEVLALREAQRNALNEQQAQFDADDKAREDAKAAQKLADEQMLADQLKQIEADKRASQMQTLDNAISIAGQESDLGKALLIAKQVLAAREAIIDARASAMKAASAARNAAVDAAGAGVSIAKGTAETAKIGFPQNIPMLVAYAAQAVGVISAIRSATRKVKGASAPSIGSVSASAPSLPQAVAPQINTVGTSGVNQIAEAINTRPIKAYVVSKDVSSAQEMDRNIVREAGI
jgi:hypothetical protein